LEIADSPKPPLHRITISKNMILDIKVSFVFFIGEKKKKALEEFLNERVGFEELPVKLAERS
jgi:6-phosphogluconolactonase/glucosamine-6-phosphate isomerase/deaminase